MLCFRPVKNQSVVMLDKSNIVFHPLIEPFWLSYCFADVLKHSFRAPLILYHSSDDKSDIL